MTVALGSLLAGASQVTSMVDAIQVAGATLGLFAAQSIAARLRVRSARIEASLSNKPVVLMLDGKIDEEAIAANGITRSDLLAKLREANALDFATVRAVVLEETGDISVLHGETLDWRLCEGVRGAPSTPG